MWNETPSRIWRDVSETADRADRLERVRQVTARVKAQLENLGTEADSLETARARYDNHPGSEAGAARTAAGLMFVAAVLIMLDVPVQYLLNSASLPGVSGWKVLLGSVALPLGIAAMIHYIVEPLCYDAARPARSIRIAKTLAASALLAVLAGATVFLFARQASGEIAGYIVSLTSASLWAVAEALPLTAGFVAMWAHMLAKPSRDAESLRSAKERIATWERLSERLAREELSLAGRVDAPAERRDRSEPMRLTSVIALLVFCIGTIPVNARAQATPPCAVFVDRSRSVDSVHRDAAIHVLLATLPAILSKRTCSRLIAGTFADEGEFAPRTLLEIPEPFLPNDCKRTRVPSPQGAQAVLVGLQGFQEHFQRKTVGLCRHRDSLRRVKFGQDWDSFQRTAAQILTAPPLAWETRTDITGILRSLALSGAYSVVLLTDGIETRRSGPNVFADASDVVIALVPARREHGGFTASRQAAEEWGRLGVRVIPYTSIPSTNWDNVRVRSGRFCSTTKHVCGSP